MNKIELIDGAMGSEFIRRGFKLPSHIWSSNVNLEAAEIVYQVHKEYAKAGSKYLTTNTFRSTKRSYIKTGLNVDDATLLAKNSLINAVSIAKKAGSNCKILGSIAPLEDCYKPDDFPGKDIAFKEFSDILLEKWLNIIGYNFKLFLYMLLAIDSI